MPAFPSARTHARAHRHTRAECLGFAGAGEGPQAALSWGKLSPGALGREDAACVLLGARAIDGSGTAVAFFPLSLSTAHLQMRLLSRKH